MKIEVLNTGSELLLGSVINSHVAHLGRELFKFGLRINRQVTVPDGDEIRQAMEESLARGTDFLIVTGGLGPTSDDITRDVAAQLFDRKLIFHPEIWDKIQRYFKERNVVPSETAKNQATVPEGALVLSNDCGTAPGLILERGKQSIILLPGPPRELKPMWEKAVEPWLQTKLSDRPPLHQRIWRVLGIGELRVQEMLEEKLKTRGDFEFGYCARPGEVDFRLITRDPSQLEIANIFIREQLGDAIYAEGNTSMEQTVVDLATRQKKWIATAESCTGGLVANRLTNVSGSSAVFGFGWVTYANEAKMQELGVSAELLQKYGAVSSEVAEAMATGALLKSKADMAVALTGIAGPNGDTAEKPVGLVWIALATPQTRTSLQKNFLTDRETFKYRASQVALDLLRRELLRS